MKVNSTPHPEHFGWEFIEISLIFMEWSKAAYIGGARTLLLWPSKKSGELLLAPLQKSRSKASTPTRWEGLYKSGNL